ncbi:MAG: response regulator [Rhodospirillales bacterium]|nr:response regulator [Rhodospirillales bacterium]MCB9995005.1 response regulator [Rhodospirillales bacterium]
MIFWQLASIGLLFLTVVMLAYILYLRRRLRHSDRKPAQKGQGDGASDAQFYQMQKLEALGQLAGGVAHDFNNVLAIIDGYVHMAANAAPEDNDKLKTYLERIAGASKRGAALTRQLLLFGRHKIDQNVVVNVSGLVTEQESLLHPLLDSDTRLVIDVDDGLEVHSAPDALGQIIMNLVINARDAMPEGGTIALEAHICAEDHLPGLIPEDKRDRDYILFSVSDTGTGIDEETASRIFDPFFTTKEQGKGTGLGLSTVYGLVQEMGGFIDLKTALGEGTSMRLYLPRSMAENEEPAAAAGQAEQIRFDGYTALVAEDEPDLLQLVTTMLEQRGMEVLAAANGAEAMTLQEQFEGDIDFLITDVVMPRLNGVKLAELVQASRDEINVIFMSGFPAKGRLARVELPDQAVLLTKPVAFEKLAGALHKVMVEQQI